MYCYILLDFPKWRVDDRMTETESSFAVLKTHIQLFWLCQDGGLIYENTVFHHYPIFFPAHKVVRIRVQHRQLSRMM